MAKRAEDLHRGVVELEDRLIKEEGRKTIVSLVLDRPTEEEVRKHNTTHTPPKPWCPYCVMGTGTRDAHCKIRMEVPDVETVIDKTHMISVDYTYF